MDEHGKQNRDMRDYLPIGTVISLKEGTKKLMIAGRIQQEAATGQIYDYCAVLWPEGMMSSSRMYLFNHEDIEHLYYVGMQDQEEFQFRCVLDSLLSRYDHQA